MIAPGYTEEALEILKQKKKGNYNVIEIDPEYVPAPLEHKQVFGVTFEQGRQELAIDDALISNLVTENKVLSEEAKRDMKVSLIVLKYTQSNSVCYVKDGQAIGVGAGQQSRVHCTRLAGQKADNWFLRQSPKVLNLPFKDTISRAERDNAIDVYIGDEYMDVLADGNWEKTFTEKPSVFTKEEKRAWLDQMTEVTLGSDAFFPFSDNIERAHKSGVKYIAQPGGSVRDADVIETCNKYNMAMAFTGIRLFRYITLPLLKPIMLYTLVTSAIGGLQMYDIPALFNVPETGLVGLPDDKTTTMAMYIMRLYNSDVGKAAAVSVVLFVITLIVSLILFATMGDSEDRRMKREQRQRRKAGGRL